VRILLDYRPALRQRTGVGEYVHELASALLETRPTGESLVLFSSSWKDRMPPWTMRPGSSNAAAPELCDLRIPVRMLNYAWHRLGWPAVERLAGRPLDVVHGMHPLLIPARTAAQIVTVHDLDFLDHPERTRAEIRRDYPTLAAAHARRADRVVVVSRHTAGEVERRLGVDAARISICSPGRPAWPRRLEEPADGRILFLGTLEPRKNLGVLLDAYERVIARRSSTPPLVLAGGATEASRPIVDRASRPPLAGRVELAGYVDPQRRHEQYQRALIFVLPSHAEGFGIPALEAMTCGVPVIAANRGALPEVVGPAGRLFDPDDPGDLAAALDGLLSDSHSRNRMREAGWAQASQFEWRDSARRTRDAWALALEARDRRLGAAGSGTR
jgi:glycosyltransferase involved in cell wall biosynthesis